jgi:hypothetical protein
MVLLELSDQELKLLVRDGTDLDVGIDASDPWHARQSA